jgi:hypothetical protein
LYRQAAAELRTWIDERLAVGLIGFAVFGLGNLGRLYLVLGQFDRAAAVQTEGEQYLPRLEPGSNNANQFLGLELFRQLLAGEDPELPLAIFDHLLMARSRPDWRWVVGPVRLGRPPLLAELGRVDEALAALRDDMPVLERAALGAPNLAMAVHWACRTVYLCEHTDLVPRLEHVLHRKVIEPGFCYGECDSHWDAALLAAVAGRPDDARSWFEHSYARLRQQEAITLIPHVACDEARMELRLGPRGSRTNARRRLDEGRYMAERIGLNRLVEQADKLARQLGL